MHLSEPATIAYATFVALDWADEKHAWALQVAGEGRVHHGSWTTPPEAIQVWASALEQRFGGRPIALTLEQSRGAVVAVRSKYALAALE